MRIVFLSATARQAALRYLLEKGEKVVAVVTPHLSEKNRRFEEVIRTANEFNVPVHAVTADTVNQTLKQLDFDILVSVGFGYILNSEALSMPRFAINVHPTLLPKYRGYRSGPYIIMNGEKESGVTVHFLTEIADAGDILAQRKIEVSPFDTTTSLYRKVRQIEGEVLYQVLQQLKDGTYRATPQYENEATLYSYMRTPKDSLIDWNKSLRELYNEIRACDAVAYPAYFYVEGQKVCIKLWRPDKPDDEEDMI